MIDCEVTKIDPIKNLLTLFVTFQIIILQLSKMLSKNQHGGQLIMNDDIATIEGKKKKHFGVH